MKVAQDTKSAFFNDIKKITGLGDSDILNFLKTYNDSEIEKVRELAATYKEEMSKAESYGQQSFNSSAGLVTVKASAATIQKQKDLIASQYSAEVKIYAATLDAYNSVNDEKITSAVNAEKKIIQIQIDSIKQQNANEVAKAKALIREDDFGNKAEDKVLAELTKRIDKEKELTNELIKRNGLSGDYKAKGKADYQPKLAVSKETTDDLFQTDKLLKYANGLEQIANNQQKVFNDSKTGWETIKESINTTTIGTELAIEGIYNLTDAFTGMFEGTEGGFKNLVTSMLGGIQSIINGLLAQAVAAMIAGEAHKGLIGLATAAIGVAALIGIWKAKVPEFANGGIVGGSSFTGDNITARLNSGEMVLNKGQQANLFNMANGGSGTAGGGEVVFRIEGNTLVGVLNNHNKRMNNFK